MIRLAIIFWLGRYNRSFITIYPLYLIFVTAKSYQINSCNIDFLMFSLAIWMVEWKNNHGDGWNDVNDVETDSWRVDDIRTRMNAYWWGMNAMWWLVVEWMTRIYVCYRDFEPDQWTNHSPSLSIFPFLRPCSSFALPRPCSSFVPGCSKSGCSPSVPSSPPSTPSSPSPRHPPPPKSPPSWGKSSRWPSAPLQWLERCASFGEASRCCHCAPRCHLGSSYRSWIFLLILLKLDPSFN